MSGDEVHFGFKAIRPIEAEQPIGSGTYVTYQPGDEVPAGEWGRAADTLVEAGKIMRYAINIAVVPEQFPSVEAPAEAEADFGPVDGDDDPVEEEESDEPFPRHEGAGWFRLSNGDRVRGKAAAMSAQAHLEVEAEG